jgi:hypothetical protein
MKRSRREKKSRGECFVPQVRAPPPPFPQSWVGVIPFVYSPQQKSSGLSEEHFPAHIVQGHRERKPLLEQKLYGDPQF